LLDDTGINKEIIEMSINGSGMKFINTGSINTNSKQYKAAMEMFGKSLTEL